VRNVLLPVLAIFLAGGLAALAQNEKRPVPLSAAPSEWRSASAAEEREAAALAFVRANHPELALLLEPLKAMKPEQYEKAIAELDQVSRGLANLKKSDPRRYQVGLDVWKARSRVEVIAAQLASAPSPELESQLKIALGDQVDAQLARQRLERSITEERLKQINKSIENLETNRDSIIESRHRELIKKGQRTRRRDEGQPTPARPARTKGERQA